ncbi:Hypothetical protein A7982_05023 [Minicystis rosea]|nr:Hypothetical protein A7982_05023 [Minicystis rosea]
MTAKATIPANAESAITTLFESAIAATRVFWAQRADGSLFCADWEWCCPEIPAVLGGMDVVVFMTRGPSSARVARSGVLVVSLDASRVWGRWQRVLSRVPHDTRASTWDDRLEVEI